MANTTTMLKTKRNINSINPAASISGVSIKANSAKSFIYYLLMFLYFGEFLPFTFTLISISIFLMIFLLGSVKLKIGFALGLFAIFGIIRYRTESMPVREMTYLFVIIAISVINALSVQLSYAELTATNLLFILCIWLCESNRWLKHISCKLVQYDRIELITPQRRAELIMDLENRTGLSITKVEVGHIDFLRDAAILKVYYEPESEEINTIDTLRRIPREGE